MTKRNIENREIRQARNGNKVGELAMTQEKNNRNKNVENRVGDVRSEKKTGCLELGHHSS